MTRPILIPFKAEHLLSFVDKDGIHNMEAARQKEKGGPAFTAIVDNKIIGCGGVVIMWSGVGMAWVAVSKDIEQYGIWVTRTVKSCLHDITRALNLHRVEAVVLTDGSYEWLEVVGFHLENSIAKRYTQDKRDVIRYEFLQEDM